MSDNLPKYVFYLLAGPIWAVAPFIFFGFYKHSKYYPIKNRAPLLSLGASICWCIVLMHEVIVNTVRPYPCVFRQIFAVIPFTNMILIQDYRILYFLFENKIFYENSHAASSSATLAEKKINDSTTTTSAATITTTSSAASSSTISRSTTNSTNWYLKNRWIIQPRTRRKIFLCLTMMESIFLIIFFSLIDSNCLLTTCPKAQIVWFSYVHMGVWGGLTLIGIFLMSKIIFLKHDSFMFKTELIITNIGIGASVIIYLFFVYYPVPRYASTMAKMVGAHCQIWTSILWPYYLSRKELKRLNRLGTTMERSREEGSHNTQMELIEILNDPAGCEAFLNFLRTEFSAENLLFWLAVEDFKSASENRNIPVHDLEERALFILSQFLIPQASYLIDLPYEIRSRLSEKAEELQDLGPPPLENELKILQPQQFDNNQDKNNYENKKREELLHFYDEAQRVTFNSMNSDSFLRFQRQEEYIQLCERGPSLLRNRISSPPTPTPEEPGERPNY